VFVNGDRVDMQTLEDGDEVTIGRFRLYFLSLTDASQSSRSLDAPGALA
jgi:pSer/pThr/pTyr-binding forkhead associated (FHA) protein